jgi:hypothetical protein
MPETILEILQDENLESHVQGNYTRIVVNPGPYFEVLWAIRQGGPYTIEIYSGEREDEACEAFRLNEKRLSK